MSGTPLDRMRAAIGRVTVAPWATQTGGVFNTRSSAEDVPSNVVCTCCGLEYDAGASFAVSVNTPADKTVIFVDAIPLWSVSTVQLAAPAHTENPTAGDELNCTLAPATGVTPSGASTRTEKGEGALPPTGVPGLVPETILIVSLGPAPTVRAVVIVELPPEFISCKSRS